jgi:GMP synthase (glutamine-hydrolysing)
VHDVVVTKEAPNYRLIDAAMILVLDFGSQYTQLIARRVRESRVYCEILPCTADVAEVAGAQPDGHHPVGRPGERVRADAPQLAQRHPRARRPVLGICYGMRIMNVAGGAEVARADRREYGRTRSRCSTSTDLFLGFTSTASVHRVDVARRPHGVAARRLDAAREQRQRADPAFRDPTQRLFGIQFHPEVVHTERGQRDYANFVLGRLSA